MDSLQMEAEAPRASNSNLADYDIAECVYSGALSDVHIARHVRSGTHVAVKAYHKHTLGALERCALYRELTIHGSLVHTHIVGLLDTFEDEQAVYLVQELASSGDLWASARANGPVGKYRDEAVCAREVIVPMLLAVGYLHARGIVHRDIKPENILLTSDGTLKLADFGLAINMHEERPVSRVGTLDYMAPEIYLCPPKLSPHENKRDRSLQYSTKVDVWALGVLAYELLTGVGPFESGGDFDETSDAVMYNEVEFPVGMSNAAKLFIKAALNRDPKDRPSARKMLQSPWLAQHVDAEVLVQHQALTAQFKDSGVASGSCGSGSASGSRASTARMGRAASGVAPAPSLCFVGRDSFLAPALSETAEAVGSDADAAVAADGLHAAVAADGGAGSTAWARGDADTRGCTTTTGADGCKENGPDAPRESPLGQFEGASELSSSSELSARSPDSNAGPSGQQHFLQQAQHALSSTPNAVMVTQAGEQQQQGQQQQGQQHGHQQQGQQQQGQQQQQQQQQWQQGQQGQQQQQPPHAPPPLLRTGSPSLPPDGGLVGALGASASADQVGLRTPVRRLFTRSECGLVPLLPASSSAGTPPLAPSSATSVCASPGTFSPSPPPLPPLFGRDLRTSGSFGRSSPAPRVTTRLNIAARSLGVSFQDAGAIPGRAASPASAQAGVIWPDNDSRSEAATQLQQLQHMMAPPPLPPGAPGPPLPRSGNLVALLPPGRTSEPGSGGLGGGGFGGSFGGPGSLGGGVKPRKSEPGINGLGGACGNGIFSVGGGIPPASAYGFSVSNGGSCGGLFGGGGILSSDSGGGGSAPPSGPTTLLQKLMQRSSGEDGSLPWLPGARTSSNGTGGDGQRDSVSFCGMASGLGRESSSTGLGGRSTHSESGSFGMSMSAAGGVRKAVSIAPCAAAPAGFARVSATSSTSTSRPTTSAARPKSRNPKMCDDPPPPATAAGALPSSGGYTATGIYTRGGGRK
ncbi:hypothetical protein FOA52_014479 [Chlamydomonas sp. UWO 241]|nr:hypothetical protein FOA52_014479 [Chlamydomonas sp. UWO 241]